MSQSAVAQHIRHVRFAGGVTVATVYEAARQLFKNDGEFPEVLGKITVNDPHLALQAGSFTISIRQAHPPERTRDGYQTKVYPSLSLAAIIERAAEFPKPFTLDRICLDIPYDSIGEFTLFTKEE